MSNQEKQLLQDTATYLDIKTQKIYLQALSERFYDFKRDGGCFFFNLTATTAKQDCKLTMEPVSEVNFGGQKLFRATSSTPEAPSAPRFKAERTNS